MMRHVVAAVKKLAEFISWFQEKTSKRSSVNIFVEKRKRINPPFIKSMFRNPLSFHFSTDRARSVAPISGVDILLLWL
jgi:hypothetical protein